MVGQGSPGRRRRFIVGQIKNNYMLNLEWFRTFKAIYEKRSLSAAAQTLFISQPGVSVHLNSLEASIGYRLFNRETRKMIPTDRGIILYNAIIDPMSRLEDAEQLFFRNCKGKPTISVGLGYETFDYALTEHVDQLSFNLIVRFGEYPQLLHELDGGALDLVLTSHVLAQPNLEYTFFTKERIVLICGGQADTELLDQLLAMGNRTGIMEWLKQQIWYTTAVDMGYLRNFWLANFDCLPDLKPNYVLPHVGAILRCMRNGKGFAVVPDFLCRDELERKTVRLAWGGSFPVENVLHFGKRKRTRNASEIAQLEELLTKNWFCRMDL